MVDYGAKFLKDYSESLYFFISPFFPARTMRHKNYWKQFP